MEKITQGHHGSLSLDMVQDNISKLKQLFPELITEDASGAKIDVDVLKELVGNQVIDGDKERYNFTWHGKAAARRLAQTPSTGTLRPCKEESKDWDTTQNLFIEGDNLEVLKLLQKSYHKKVKMIYIDPPYNTGKDFIYTDNFKDNIKNYLDITGQLDKEGRRISANSETSGRFHTKWLNMMYPRLKLARNLLTNDGVIFISINDKEVSNLKYLCNEIFSEDNFLCQFSWRTDGNFDNQAKFKNCHEYVLVYAKDEEQFPHPPVIDPNTPPDSKLFRPEIRNTIVKNGPKNPASKIELPAGFPAEGKSTKITSRKDAWPHYDSDVIIENYCLKNSVNVYSGWSSKELLLSFIKNKFNPVLDSKGQETVFKIIDSGAIEAIKTRSDKQSHVISVLNGLGGSQKATAELESLDVIFDDYPKPVDLIKYFISMNEGTEFTILDFFAGSCATAEAVYRKNMEDSGNRNFIAIQLPESTIKIDENGKEKQTEAYKSGYATISQIGVDRIKKAGQKLQNSTSNVSSLDFGVKIFQLNSSNIKPWDANFDNLEDMLAAADDSLKKDRTADDVLYEILLKYGLDLTLPIEEHILAGKTVHNIGCGALMICLDDEITLDVVNAIGDLKKELQPEVMRVVFKDAGFADPVVKTNAIQVLKQFGIDDVKSI